jgi:hypothetical protein
MTTEIFPGSERASFYNTSQQGKVKGSHTGMTTIFTVSKYREVPSGLIST